MQSVTALLPSAADDDSGHAFCTPPAHHDPTGQTAQVAPAGPKNPGTQKQSSTVVLPALESVSDGQDVQFEDPAAPEYVPAGHDRHSPLPVSALYWPMLHAVHTLPSNPLYPARHVQSLKTVLPSPEVE